MSADISSYREHLELFPEKERKALEQSLFLESEQEDRVKSTIRQINRSKSVKDESRKTAKKQLLTVSNV